MNFQTIVLVGGWESVSCHPILDFGFCEKFVDAQRPGGNFKAFQDGFWINSTDKSAIFSDFGF
ncbi:MAG: hypothetical protein C4323_15895 [Mastigocladus sp. ERB_26_2]